MYQGIESGAIETKEQHQKKDDENMQKLMMIAKPIDRSALNGG